MARTESKQVTRAVDTYLAVKDSGGWEISIRQAARAYGIAPSTIVRALKRYREAEAKAKEQK